MRTEREEDAARYAEAEAEVERLDADFEARERTEASRQSVLKLLTRQQREELEADAKATGWSLKRQMQAAIASWLAFRRPHLAQDARTDPSEGSGMGNANPADFGRQEGEDA